jgi:hypothetical protein
LAIRDPRHPDTPVTKQSSLLLITWFVFLLRLEPTVDIQNMPRYEGSLVPEPPYDTVSNLLGPAHASHPMHGRNRT